MAKGGREISWDEAFTLAVAGLKSIPPEAIGIIASPASTNESLFLLGKLARVVLATNNLDFPGREAMKPTQILLSRVGEVACAISDLADADLIIMIGVGDGDLAPQIAPRVWEAARRGAHLATIGTRAEGIAAEATIHIASRPNAAHAWIDGVGALLSPRFHAKNDDGQLHVVSGVPLDAIEELAALVRASKRIAFVYDASSAGHLADGRSIVALSRLLGWCRSEKEWVGVLPIMERNNSLGALDMGIAPDLLPGWQPLSDPAAVRRIEDHWRGLPPARPGMDLRRMIRAAAQGDLRGLVVIGNPAGWVDPSAEEVRQAFRKIEFLLVVESFPSPVTSGADLILPRPLPGEVKGTYTSTEGRIQATHPEGSSRLLQEWTIITEIAERMGADWDYGGLVAVDEEIGRLIPEYAGAATSPSEGFIRSLWGDGGYESAEEPHAIPIEMEDPDFPLLLCVERAYQPFHLDPDLLRSPIMRREMVIQPAEPHLFLNPADAKDNGIKSGGRAKVRSRNGAASLRVVCETGIARGRAVLPEIHYGAMKDIFGERPTDGVTGRLLYPAPAIAIRPER